MCCKKQDSFYLKRTICCRNLQTCENMVNNVFPFSLLHKQITLQLFILFSHFRFFLSFCAIFQLFWWLVQEQESPYHAFLDIWSHLHLWCRNWSQGPTNTQGEDKGFIFFRLALKQIDNPVEPSVRDQPRFYLFSEVVNFSICRKPVVNIHLDKHNNSGQPGRRILERTPPQCQPTFLVVLLFVFRLWFVK